MPLLRPLVVMFGCAVGLSCGEAAEHWINSGEALAEICRDGTVQPGDTIIWRDGVYLDERLYVTVSGTPEAPVRLRAETPGGVMLKGESAIKFGGDHIEISGFFFYNGDNYDRDIPSALVQFRSNNGNRHAHHCRLTQCAFIDYNFWEVDSDDDDEDGDFTEKIWANSKWVQIYGTHNRVDHCYFSGKIVRGALIVVEMVPQDGDAGTPYASYGHRIDHNFFGPNPVGWSENEFETIRVGTSSYANFRGDIVVERNHFLQCDGEIEVVSNKSSHNTYRENIFIGCKGSLVLRHGDFCVVERNVFLGLGVAETGGIRLNGEGHLIRDNYLEGIRGTGLRAALALRAAGSVSGDDTRGGYEQVRDVRVVHNTVLDSTEPLRLVELGGKDNSYLPTASVVANNLLVSAGGPVVHWDRPLTGMTYAGNLYDAPTLGQAIGGFGAIEAQMVLRADGLRAASAAALPAADPLFPGDTVDLDGQPRPSEGVHVGADQRLAGGSMAAPLAAFAVGPSWMGRDTEITSQGIAVSGPRVLRWDLQGSAFARPGGYGLWREDLETGLSWAMPYLLEGPGDGDTSRVLIPLPEDDTPTFLQWRTRPGPGIVSTE